MNYACWLLRHQILFIDLSCVHTFKHIHWQPFQNSVTPTVVIFYVKFTVLFEGGGRLISFVLESVNNEVCTLFDVTVRCWETGFGLYGEHSGCIFKGHYFVPSYFVCLFQVECTDICRNVGIDLRRELILNFVVMSTSEFRRFIKLALLFNLILLTFSSGAVEPTSFKNRQIYRFLAEPTNAEFHCCVLNC